MGELVNVSSPEWHGGAKLERHETAHGGQLRVHIARARDDAGGDFIGGLLLFHEGDQALFLQHAAEPRCQLRDTIGEGAHIEEGCAELAKAFQIQSAAFGRFEQRPGDEAGAAGHDGTVGLPEHLVDAVRQS